MGRSWMRMRAEDEDEQTQRHPHAWWDERYKWINEEGEKTCGRDVLGLQYMRGEFPEQNRMR